MSQPSPARDTRPVHKWALRLIAFVTLANGVISILSVLLTRFREPRLFSMVLPFGIYHWTRSVTVALGFVLIYLSYHLLQGRRVAWWSTTVVTGLVLAGHVIHPRLWLPALAPAITLALLVAFRRSFRVRSEIRNIRQGLFLVAVSLVVAVGYGTIGFWLLDRRDFGITFDLTQAFVRTMRQFTLIGNADLIAHTRFARSFLGSLSVMGTVTAAFAVYSLFRPVAFRLVSLPRQQAEAVDIVKQYGRSSYDYFKPKPDKSYFFSKTRRTFIAYRTIAGVALCLGDPVGPGDELETTAAAFLDFCSDNGWLTTFLLPDSVDPYKKIGLSLLKVGEEGIVDLEHFRAQTMGRKYFRYVKRKTEGEGATFARYKPPHPLLLLDEVEQVSREWMTIERHREIGFFQGTFSRRYIAETPLCCVRDGKGRLSAWVNEVPSFRPGEATFDMMRHLPGVHWGIMDYLFSNMMLALREEGHRTLNMGLAPLAGVGERPQATLLEKAVHQIYEHMDRVVSAKGLRQYKLKFEPEWEERFIAYSGGTVGLIRIGIAISRVL